MDATIVASAMQTGVEDAYKAEEDHTVPAAMMSLSPENARGGDSITVSGEGFPAYQPVNIEVGNLPVAANTNTNGDGDFTVTILLPALDVGTPLVKITVHGTSASQVLTVPVEPIIITKASADAFADLIAADNLIVVWYFDNDTKGWSFYDPRPEVAAAVDLTDGHQRRHRLDTDHGRPRVPRRNAEGRLEPDYPQLGPRDRNQARRGRASSGPAPPFSKGTWRNE